MTAQVRKLRPGASVRPYDPSKTIGDPTFVQKAIVEALLDGDCEAVMEIYSAHLRVLNRSRAAEKLHVSRQHVHRMMNNPNPRMDTFARFMGLLKTEVLFPLTLPGKSPKTRSGAAQPR